MFLPFAVSVAEVKPPPRTCLLLKEGALYHAFVAPVGTDGSSQLTLHEITKTDPATVQSISKLYITFTF